jgi:hypothetical protein
VRQDSPQDREHGADPAVIERSADREQPPGRHETGREGDRKTSDHRGQASQGKELDQPGVQRKKGQVRIVDPAVGEVVQATVVASLGDLEVPLGVPAGQDREEAQVLLACDVEQHHQPDDAREGVTHESGRGGAQRAQPAGKPPPGKPPARQSGPASRRRSWWRGFWQRSGRRSGTGLHQAPSR